MQLPFQTIFFVTRSIFYEHSSKKFASQEWPNYFEWKPTWDYFSHSENRSSWYIYPDDYTVWKLNHNGEGRVRSRQYCRVRHTFSYAAHDNWYMCMQHKNVHFNNPIHFSLPFPYHLSFFVLVASQQHFAYSCWNTGLLPFSAQYFQNEISPVL